MRPANTQWVAKDTMFLHADSEDSDQTQRMARLTCIFAGRTGHSVGFVMWRLKYCLVSDPVKWLRISWKTHGTTLVHFLVAWL